MPLPSFYNDNAARSYPLVPFSGVPLFTPASPIPPLDALVDFGCLVGLDAEFDSGRNVVYLYQISRAGNVFTFDFRSDAPGLLEYKLLFSRDLADAEYTTDYAKATSLDGSGEPQDTLWEGFLVTGPMDGLAALMPQDETVGATNPQVEPALIQNLGRSYLRTVNLANQDRTHATLPKDCPGAGDAAEAAYIVNARGLIGALRFKEGYNVSIRQNNRSNSLAFAASQAAGAGTPCYEVPLYPGEPFPDGSTLLTGGPACDEVVSSINGLTASIIRLVPDLGVTIVPSEYPNTLIVDFDRNNMTVCGPVAAVVEELDDV